jgi:MFS family permease
VFASPTDRREYWAIVVGTFLCFSATSQLSYLAVILKQAGIADPGIGVISAAWSVAAIVGPVLSRGLIDRYGAVRTIIFGWFLILVSFAALQASYAAVVPATVCRAVAGLGFGIFIPAGIVAVNARVVLPAQVYYLGVFSSMMYIPNLFGPVVAEGFIDHLGPNGFFLAMSLPILAGICVVTSFVRTQSAVQHHPDSASYLVLLRQPILVIICTAIFTSGLLWAFVSTFLALWMRQSELDVGLFFTPFAATMIVSRFGLLRFASARSKQAVLAAALALMGAAHVVLATGIGSTSAIAAGVLFALGYSALFPTAIVWANSKIVSDLQSRMAALLNVVFNIAGVAGPIGLGYLIPAVGFGYSAAIGALLGLLTTLLLLWPAAHLPPRDEHLLRRE